MYVKIMRTFMKHIESIDVNSELRKAQGNRSLRKFADEIHCSAAYLSDIYNGRRNPGPTILEYLGLRKIVRKHITIRYKRINANG